MGAGSIMSEKTKSIFVDYKGKIFKITFTRNATNQELQEILKTSTKSNHFKVILKDSSDHYIQLTSSIGTNTPDNPYKVEALEATVYGQSMMDKNTTIHDKIKSAQNVPPNVAAVSTQQQSPSTNDSINEIVKELVKALKFEESKNELMNRIDCLEKRINGLNLESLKAIEVEKLRKEFKDLKESLYNSSLKKNEDNNKKLLSLENIPTYPKYQLTPETIQYLKTPTFNVWWWESNEMLSLLEHMYHELDLVRELNINPITLKRWLLCVQSNYRNNPFHNFRHCFCVAQMMYGIIHLCELDKKMSKIDIAILLTAAICHDLDHPGYNNAYQINARTELAIRYNDISPLENHHCAVAFQILSNPQCNIFSNLSEDVYREIRNGMVKLILATDMAKHKDILEELQSYIPNFDFSNKNHMDALKNILIKCCDISNEVRPMEVSEPWLDCLLEEYFMQSDREKVEGLPVAPFMDREKVTKPGAQLGFIKFVLIPLFETVAKLFPVMQDAMVKTLYESYDRYQELKEQEEKDKSLKNNS